MGCELICMYHIHCTHKTRDPLLYELLQKENQALGTEKSQFHQLQRNQSKQKIVSVVNLPKHINMIISRSTHC